MVNAAAIAGNIALIDRGICTFVAKAQAAQAAGAIGVIIANNVAAGCPAWAAPIRRITIPCVGISQADGNAIKANLAGGRERDDRPRSGAQGGRRRRRAGR